MDVKVKVFKMFNEELGSDLTNLKNIEQIHKKLEQGKNKVEQSLSLASMEAPSRIQEAVQEVNDIVCNVNKVKARCELLREEIEERLKQESRTLELQSIIDDISCLERASSYLEFVKFVEDMSSELEVSLTSGNDEACISSYCILKETCQNLESSSCANLKNYLRNTLYYWYDEIKNKFAREYDEVLVAVKWPFCGANANAAGTQSSESLARFKILTEHLFNLQLPDNMTKEKPSGISVNFVPVCLPVSLLVKPLRQRFFFHFTGNRKTNRVDKPEWFFTQTLNYIKDHVQWIDLVVQPIACMAGFSKTKVKIEFMREMVRMAVEKLNTELEDVQYDDSLFAHVVDEALGFEKELRDSYKYPPTEPAAVFVLTQAQIFIKWITMEKKYATEKMDAILSSESAWSKLPGLDRDDLKITICSDAFLTLLNIISDRYRLLPQPGHKLQFLELQLELIDDWRVRLLQLLHDDYKDPLSSLKPLILNAIYYVDTVLQDWGVSVPFLKLYFFKKQCEDAEKSMLQKSFSNTSIEENENDGTVFDEAISLLKRIEKKLMTEIGDVLFMEIKSKSRLYCNDKWFAMPSDKECLPSLTISACPMFQEIANRLRALQNALALPLFEQSWMNLALCLDKLLFEELVLQNKFNDGGAAQFQYDVRRNLFPLFGLYTKKPESYFPLIGESCILLNMLLGSVILLLEALENADEDVKKDVLADVNIHQLSSQLAIRVLKTRMDISTR
ncbi:RAD50-interacting protein 1 [Copidosoma floridanum]|uniref:RAD50-interacting protein 1 n=1 Tax=Copidosoma floridanum TaxID=29053 RepID=UPI0006C9B1D3|nr:RAD50-interacting protein 1 [Copidosoma floridanum]